MQLIPLAVALEVIAHYAPCVLAHDGTLPNLSGIPFFEDDVHGRRYVCLNDKAHEGVTYRTGPFHPHDPMMSDPKLFATHVNDLRARAAAPWN